MSTDPVAGRRTPCWLARPAISTTELLFDHAITEYRNLPEDVHGLGMLFNPFTFREIHLRGLISAGRADEAVQLLHNDTAAVVPVAPQWHVIEGVTARVGRG